MIAKADAISKTELQKFKNKLLSELVSNGVQIQQFPTDNETIAKINASGNGHLPFVAVGSMDDVQVVIGCQNPPVPLGCCPSENHCDFVRLWEMLTCTNMGDLPEQTHARHYGLCTRCKREEMGFADVGPENKPLHLKRPTKPKGTILCRMPEEGRRNETYACAVSEGEINHNEISCYSSTLKEFTRNRE